jgi:hypothetical protein
VVFAISILFVPFGGKLVSLFPSGPSWLPRLNFDAWGISIIGSLAGTSFFGPVAGHGSLSHHLVELREERRRLMPAQSGHVPGSVEAVPAEPEADHFVRIHKKHAAEDGLEDEEKQHSHGGDKDEEK